MQALADEMRAQREAGTVRRGTFTADRDRPNTCLSVIEFDSYESAMENSNRPETAEFSSKMAALCDGPPSFRNLDVMQTWPESAAVSGQRLLNAADRNGDLPATARVPHALSSVMSARKEPELVLRSRSLIPR